MIDIDAAITAAIEGAFWEIAPDLIGEQQCEIYFAYRFEHECRELKDDGLGRPLPEELDPTLLVVWFPDWDDGPHWQISLSDAVDDLIEQPWDLDGKAQRMVRDALAAQVTRLDDYLAKLEVEAKKT